MLFEAIPLSEDCLDDSIVLLSLFACFAGLIALSFFGYLRIDVLVKIL